MDWSRPSIWPTIPLFERLPIEMADQFDFHRARDTYREIVTTKLKN